MEIHVKNNSKQTLSLFKSQFVKPGEAVHIAVEMVQATLVFSNRPTREAFYKQWEQAVQVLEACDVPITNVDVIGGSVTIIA